MRPRGPSRASPRRAKGGQESSAQRLCKLLPDGSAEVIGGLADDGAWHNPLLAAYRFAPGEAFRIETGGGGGWGDPMARPVERVLDDVLDDYISIDEARASYGVVIDPEERVVDIAATETLRGERRAA